MYVAKNPFTLNFGKVPSLYIDRSILIDEIEECLTSEEIQDQCFMLSGMRGSGKTVTMHIAESNGRFCGAKRTRCEANGLL